MTEVTARIFLSGVDHSEGVAWNPLTNEVVFGTEGGEMFSIGLDANAMPRRLSSGGGFLLGVAVDSSTGDIYACDMTEHCIWRWDANTGESTVFATGTSQLPMRVPNSTVMRENGSLWVSDSGSCWDAADGLIWSISPDGMCTPATSDPMSFPNGLARSPDRDYLYVLETFPPALKRLRIMGDLLGTPELVTELPETVPDGLAFTDDGDILIGCYRPDQVIRVYEGAVAEVSVVFSDPTGRFLAGPANICFAGPNLDRLIVSNVGGNHLTELETNLRGSAVRSREVDK